MKRIKRVGVVVVVFVVLIIGSPLNIKLKLNETGIPIGKRIKRHTHTSIQPDMGTCPYFIWPVVAGNRSLNGSKTV